MRYAGFWRRLIAATIDQFIVGLVAYFIGQVFAVVAMYLPPFSEAKASVFMNYGVIIGYVALGLAYFSLLEGKTGVTVGKRLMNLKLVRFDQPNRDGIGVGRAFVRTVFAFVTQLFAGVNYILMLLSPERRTLQDKVMKTIVVYDSNGSFPSFDPDKLPVCPRRRVLFALTLIISFLSAVGQIVYFSSLV